MEIKENMQSFMRMQQWKKYGVWLNKIKAEVLIPIPMYSRKKRLRGYNQAEVFARELGRKAGILVDEHLVRRVRNTIPQKELNESQRHRNLKMLSN